MKTALRKAVVIALIAVCAGTLAFIIYLDEHFCQTRPRHPEPQVSRIYPQWIHGGTRVYLTRIEKLPFDTFWYVGLVSVAARLPFESALEGYQRSR